MADKEKPQAPRPYPRWLSWVFVLFLVYILYQGNFNAPHKTVPANTTTAADATPATKPVQPYPALHAFTDKDRWQRAINPDFIGATTWHDVKDGSGVPAECGDRITVRLRGTLENGANFDDAHKEETPLTFTLGAAPYRALDNALIGLKPGGARQITAPPQFVYKEGVNKTRESVVLYVERTDEGASVVPSQLPLTSVEDQSGNGAGVACGESVPVNVTVWDDKGLPAYKTAAPVKLALGKRELSPLFDASLVGLAPGGSRTLVLLPGNLAPAKSVPAALQPLRAALDRPHLLLVTVGRAS